MLGILWEARPCGVEDAGGWRASPIEAAQLKRVTAGEFGVRAQAKPAAPRVLKRVIRKAGGDVGADGEPVGEAERDADQIRAADLVLQRAGEEPKQRDCTSTSIWPSGT